MESVGLAILLLYYGILIIVGIVAFVWFKKRVLCGTSETREVALVAGRKLGYVVGICSMTATTIGGSYILVAAETMSSFGLAWTQAPFAVCIGLVIGGTVFAKRMRENDYVTMLDPFHRKYGDVVVGLLYVTATAGDILWSAVILAGLGSSLNIMADLHPTVVIVTSALVAVVYTTIGQLIAVVYTNVIQLILIVVGLILPIPFVLRNSHPRNTTETVPAPWMGSLQGHEAGMWIDVFVALTLGYIPWQWYFQRVLAAKTTRHAQTMSIASGVWAMILAIPAMLVGAIVANTDWTFALDRPDLYSDEKNMALPLALVYLTPRYVRIVGVGAMAAVVMSSLDSALLSCASLFTHNIYKAMLNKQAPERELMIVQRIAVVVVGAVAVIIALFGSTLYGLFYLAADAIFILLFPQLVCVLFVRHSNAYGSIFGYAVGLLLRLAAGDHLLGIPALIKYPFYSEEYGSQLFPHRTLAMLSSLVSIVGASTATRFLFVTRKIPASYDILRCFQGGSSAGGQRVEGGMDGDAVTPSANSTMVDLSPATKDAQISMIGAETLKESRL